MLAETHSDKETILIRDDDRTYIGSLPSIELLANYYRWLPTPKGLRTNHQPTIDCVFETLEELEQLIL
jgi:hypothetical protein